MGAFTAILILSLSFTIFCFIVLYFDFRKQLNEENFWKSLKVFAIIFAVSFIQSKTIQESIKLRKQETEKSVEFYGKLKNTKEIFNFDTDKK